MVTVVQPYCGTHTLVNRQRDHLVAAPLRCKCWACDDCAPINREQLMRHVARGAPNAFITLTVDPATLPSQDAGAQLIVAAWRKLRRRIEAEARRDPTKRPHGSVLRRHWPDGPDEHGRWPNQARLPADKLAFVIVLERHKSGWPHAHVACRSAWIEWEWLQREWFDLTGATHVDIRAIKDPARTGWYVGKYMGKDPARFAGCKRYWCSQDFILPDEAEDAADDDDAPEWERVEYPLSDFVAAQVARGWTPKPLGRAMELWPP